MTSERRDQGETLIEVVMTISIIALAVTALIASLASASKSSASHRQTQTADVVIRDYAETVKLATAACVPGDPYVVEYRTPDGFSVGFTAITGVAGVCPTTSTVQVLSLKVTTDSGSEFTMQMAVRSP